MKIYVQQPDLSREDRQILTLRWLVANSRGARPIRIIKIFLQKELRKESQYGQFQPEEKISFRQNPSTLRDSVPNVVSPHMRRDPMKQILIIPLLILYCATVVNADIYTWTDDQGTVTYTDNPALIPVHSSGLTQAGTKTSLRIPKKQKEIRKHGKSWSQAVIPGNRSKVVAATIAQQKVVPLEMQSEIKEHLGGDQNDPAPPSMNQPLSISSGSQPPPVSPGMEQSKPLDMGTQPALSSPGMKKPQPVR
jgi:hypothetical protein